MAKALAKKVISLKNGPQELHTFLTLYHATLYSDSSTELGHVYWSAPVGNWILVMRKGNKVHVTFHAADDCPCKKL